MEVISVALENFCESFSRFVTNTWRENHLDIYINIRNNKLEISCYGLGKVNWSGEPDPEDPYYESLQTVLKVMPKGCACIYVQFYCGEIIKVEMNV